MDGLRWGFARLVPRAVVAGLLAATVLVLATTATGSASQPDVVVRVDSVSILADGSSQVRIRVEPEPPGVGTFRADIHYDSSHIEVTSCTPLTCSIDAIGPDTVRVNNVNAGGLSGTVATLTVEAVADSGQSELTINPDTLQVYTKDALPIDDVEAHAGVATIVQTLTQGDVNCDGTITAADGLLVLEAASGTVIEARAGCSPPGNLIGALLWGDVDCDELLTAVDALAIITHSSGAELTPAPAFCPPIGSTLA